MMERIWKVVEMNGKPWANGKRVLEGNCRVWIKIILVVP